MKITGGKYARMNISSVSDKRTRYTPAIVREALFNMINVEGMDILELFGGSGIISAEALSRSAGSVTIVEISKSSCDTIRKNLERIDGKIKILNLDFRIALRRLVQKQKFDLVFADPPFGTGLLIETFNEIDRYPDILNKDGIIVIESFEKELPPDQGRTIYLSNRKTYGDVILNFYEKMD
ncbi:16S rRNA (guanine(966)-N(2))-methyltransferase RsmD [Athalassotoga saccharophila]|uniref:16S rRNA (guanine(966)-N(2))-methyltransferase RsmD n=1 Tax=Athalassotoga saccharophila TaxID=1441386 RepID=UPI001E4E10D2|nr:16S rRNA (guanine(966)-N(2))-methyltransferase RsmD [Athalassotoga saccharophila]BBJ28903.1 ribosomal RNA small subunit methyltransferase D [Athalassotoga saccharophila]